MELSRRKRSLIAALAFASAAGDLRAALRGTSRSARPRVNRRRRPRRPGQWPFAVAIFRKGHMHCSGSVIGPTKVLTAGHCVDGFNLANFQVIVGRPTLRDTSVGQSIGVVSGRVHPDFEQTGLHDVAVLNLAAPANVTPVALATPDQNAATTPVGAQLQRGRIRRDQSVRDEALGLPEGDNRAVAGRQPLPEGLHARPVRAREHDLRARCSQEEPGRFKIHTTACSGDSGGPLVADTATGPVEVGTVSYGGALCGLPAAPTVYSRVSASLDFINAP